MIINSLPFVGFGFLDNFTMIIAGDCIEHSVGMIMTISTMAAAALGNTISDVLGIGSAVYIERLVEVIGIRAPKLSPVQLEMKSSRRASNFVNNEINILITDQVLICLFISGSCIWNNCWLFIGHATVDVPQREKGR